MEVKANKHCRHCHNKLRLILKLKSYNTSDKEFETYHKLVMTVKEKNDCD